MSLPSKIRAFARSVSLLFALLFATALGAGCTPPQRVANNAWLVGGMAGAVENNSESGAVGGVTAKGEIAETEDNITGWGHIDVAIGGNTTGWAGQGILEGELGGAAFDGEHHLFGRAGLAGTLERDPYSGLFAMEIPTATAGYQFHGDGGGGWGDSLHLDIGVHGGLLAAGRIFAGPRQIDHVADPELGGLMTVLGEFVKLRLGYVAVFGDEIAHIVRGSACFAAFVAVCVDTRHILTDVIAYEGIRTIKTSLIGITFGVGLSTGYDYDFTPWPL